MKRIKTIIRSFASFSIPLLTIVFLKCDLSLAQICSVSCTQTAVARNRPYQEAFEIIQNRGWEQEDEFGGDLADLIRRHKRVKRAPHPDFGGDLEDFIQQHNRIKRSPHPAPGPSGNLLKAQFFGSIIKSQDCWVWRAILNILKTCQTQAQRYSIQRYCF